MLYIEDEYIKYDLKEHQYYITDALIQDKYGFSVADKINFTEEKDIEKFLKRASKIVYGIVYKALSIQNQKQIAEYLIATNYENYRDGIANGICGFVYSVCMEGFDHSFQTGINSKKEIEKIDLHNQALSMGAENELLNSGVLFYGTYTAFDLDKIKKLKEEGEF